MGALRSQILKAQADLEKNQIAAEKAAAQAKDGMIVGLGTGSTVLFAIQKLGELVRQGLKIQTVSSSVQSEKIATDLGIPATSFDKIDKIDLYIDGADEVDKNHFLIKGGGAALLREKILAHNSKRFVMVADESKMVDTLGKFPLPVEIIPFGFELTLKNIRNFCPKAEIRSKDGKDVITDNGNLVADCYFGSIPDPAGLNQQLHAIPGVVETGIFHQNIVSEVIIGFNDGTVRVYHR
ncbi:MAG: ribose-5-phosphate isomerase RpiA [Sphingobacteriales bacterium]|nr:MAG: ribose-5-phosphate isomerase RpiA [Sphingobacteriales bacterium]